MRRLLPDPGPTTVDEQLEAYRPWEEPREERPFVAMNFAATRRRAGDDRRRLRPDRLRRPTRRCWPACARRFDAVMIGAGTMRAERYGRLARAGDASDASDRPPPTR